MSAIAEAMSPELSPAADRRRRIIAIVGACSGNLVEWYDFYAYAFTSIYFASAFFPSGDATSQLLATAGIFAVGFFLALVIFPGRARHRVPTLRAALARHAIGNCHHFEPADGARDAVGATTGGGGR